MAFPVDTATGVYDDATTDAPMTYPSYEVDDILIAYMSQDGGGTTISNVDSDWILVQDSQSLVNGQRFVAFYKIMASITEVGTTFVGRLETWSWNITSYRGVDTTTPIHDKARAGFSASRTHDSTALTTTVDGCLIIYAWGSDQNTCMRPETLENLNFTAALKASGNNHIVGYLHQAILGAVPIVTIEHESTSEGGEGHVIALQPDGTTGAPVEMDTLHQPTVSYGQIETVIAATDPSIEMNGATVNGITVDTGFDAVSNSNYVAPDNRFRNSRMTVNASSAGGWNGGYLEFNATLDMEDKPCSIEFLLTNFKSNRNGAEGMILAFIDSTGDWTAIQLSSFASIPRVVSTRHFNLSDSDYYDQSTTAPDLTDMVGVAWLCHRVNSTVNTSVIAIRNLIIKETVVLKGGSVDNPVSPAFLSRMVDGWTYIDQSSNQGTAQAVTTYSIQWGNGTDTTYVDTTASALQPKLRNAKNTLATLSQSQTIYASATCTMNFKGIMVANPQQSFSFHASSSASATYDFSGGGFVGWDFTGLSGIEIAGASFTDCSIEQNSGDFTSCTILNTLVTVDDLDLVTKCSMTSGSQAGHAVDLGNITADTSVTWDNTDSGYAATNGSTGDETILVDVDATFTLTINVSPIGTIPTINNTGSGTVTIVSGLITLSVTVLDDSTGLALPLAHVRLVKSIGKSMLINGATDIAGVITASIAYDVVTDVQGWARQMDLVGTDYIPKDFSGQYTSSGFSAIIRLEPIV